VKVFTDLHHNDLYFSLHRLFEDRLGWELYRPTGLDWFYQGYWKIAEPYGNAMDTVGQYLNPGPVMPKPWIPGINYTDGDIYYMFDPVHEYYHKAITIDTFKLIKFDLILSTIQAHDQPYLDLQRKFQPNAKVAAQMGNTGQKTILSNVMHSVPYNPRPGQNSVYCHQEIDPVFFGYTPPSTGLKNIYSVVNCFPYPELYNSFKSALPEVTMRAYGGGSPDGGLFGSKGVSAKMKEANIGWHLKPQGGIGHSSMGWLSIGRAVITNMSQHRSWGGDAVALFEPGVTCIDIEAYSANDCCSEIRRWLEPDENLRHSELAHRRFADVINYDDDETKVRNFLGNLL
jgi:hypothetical protein